MKRKSNLKRIISFSLAFILAMSSILMLSSCSKKDKLAKEVVGKVGNYDVHYEELRWMTMQYKDLLAATYGADIWENEETAKKYLPELEDAVYSSIISNYAVLTLCEQDILVLNGEKLIDINSDEIQNVVDGVIDKAIDEMGSKSEYRKSLEKNYLTEDLFRFINGVDVCENLLFKYYCSLSIIDDSDDAAVDYIYDNFIRTVHVYIQNDPKDNVDDNRALAVAIKAKLDNGEDIHELVEKYSEDSFKTGKDGYYFPKGTYSEAYENASFALKVGEVSEVVETFSGFYVIKRMELDDKYIAANFLSSLKNQYLLTVFDEHIKECKDKLSFTPNDFGKTINLAEMK